MARASEVEALIRATVDTYGRLDCAPNNAGIEGPTAPIADYNESDFDRLIGINLKGVWLCMKYEIILVLASYDVFHHKTSYNESVSSAKLSTDQQDFLAKRIAAHLGNARASPSMAPPEQ